MDVPRANAGRRRWIRRIGYSSVAIVLVAGATLGLSQLQPAAPSVERSTLIFDKVKRGLMLRQVRGPPLRDTNGYYQVCLHANAKSRRVLIHSLVAAAFLGPRPADAEINHKTGQKRNNTAANLEYVTRAQNRRHASAAGLCARGQRNGATSLTDAEVSRIKARLLAGWPQVALAAHRRVHKSLINRIARGECWGWLAAAEGEFDAFVIKGRLTAHSRWRTVGCEDSLPAATTAVAQMADNWYELQVLHHGRPLVTNSKHDFVASGHGRDSCDSGWMLFG